MKFSVNQYITTWNMPYYSWFILQTNCTWSTVFLLLSFLFFASSPWCSLSRQSVYFLTILPCLIFLWFSHVYNKPNHFGSSFRNDNKWKLLNARELINTYTLMERIKMHSIHTSNFVAKGLFPLEFEFGVRYYLKEFALGI